jgi:hypothetical protein
MLKNNIAASSEPLEVVFLTNFSDTAFRTIPAIAQMADDIDVNLTIVHAYDSKKQRHADVETALHSFFPEADRYSGTTRRALPGTPVDVLRRVRDSQPVDLVVCPASDLLGLPRPTHRSLRARILREIGVPVWTIGRGIDPLKLLKPVQNVGCWMDFDSGSLGHVELAAEYAAKVNARLHLFYVTPEIHEGVILPVVPDRALHPDGVRNYFQNRLGHLALQPEIHMTARQGRAMAKLTKSTEADVLFTSVSTRPLFSGFQNVDACPCPAICVGRKFTPQTWNLKPGSSAKHKATALALHALQAR